MKKEKKPVKDYNGIEYESDEELMTLLWMEELQDRGYIERIERAPTHILSEAMENRYEEIVQMKTKSKSTWKKQVLLHAHEYTAEFQVLWKPKAVNTKLLWKSYKDINEKKDSVFIYQQGADGPIIYIEVKPSWDAQNMERLFKINQKWMWDKYRIFVNLIKPHKLFAETFTPKRWLTTPTGKQRAINWPIKSIEQYLNE